MTQFKVKPQSSPRQTEESHELCGNQAEMPNGYLTRKFTSSCSVLATEMTSVFHKFQ